MAIALTVDKVDGGGVVHVRHIFYAETLADCKLLRDKHGEGCKAFGPALREGRVVEEHEEIDDSEWPEYDDDPEDSSDGG